MNTSSIKDGKIILDNADVKNRYPVRNVCKMLMIDATLPIFLFVNI